MDEAKMYIDKGSLYMLNADTLVSAQGYLREWQGAQQIANDTPVRLLTEDHFNKLMKDLEYYKAAYFWSATDSGYRLCA